MQGLSTSPKEHFCLKNLMSSIRNSISLILWDTSWLMVRWSSPYWQIFHEYLLVWNQDEAKSAWKNMGPRGGECFVLLLGKKPAVTSHISCSNKKFDRIQTCILNSLTLPRTNFFKKCNTWLNEWTHCLVSWIRCNSSWQYGLRTIPVAI